MDGDVRPGGQDPRGQDIQRWLMQQLKASLGSARSTDLEAGAPDQGPQGCPQRSAEISIEYFYPSDANTVGMRGELLDQVGQPLGRLELFLNYGYLMQDILTEGWMVAQMACLVNQEVLPGPQQCRHGCPAFAWGRPKTPWSWPCSRL